MKSRDIAALDPRVEVAALVPEGAVAGDHGPAAAIALPAQELEDRLVGAAARTGEAHVRAEVQARGWATVEDHDQAF